MAIHETGNEREKKVVEELKAKGVTLYSISRLNAFNGCKYEYYNTYVKRNRGENNVYSEIGTFTHQYLEDAYRGNITDFSDFASQFNVKLFELELQDMYFPNESIEASFRNDMIHFCNNFKKLDGEFQLEKMYIAKFGEYYMYGYIDAIREHGDNQTDVIDFKTSSKFTGGKLVDAGRQLIVYKLGLEQKGMTIDKVMWNMLKYCYVCHKQKNGKIKQKMVNRGKIIKEMRKPFEKLMLNNNFDPLTIMTTLDAAEQANDFNMLPDCIKDTYWIEDCLLEYEVTDEKVEEVQEYVTSTIKEIESMDFEDEDVWTPLDIDKNNFYCNTLCSHRNQCPHLKEWKARNPFKKIGF